MEDLASSFAATHSNPDRFVTNLTSPLATKTTTTKEINFTCALPTQGAQQTSGAPQLPVNHHSALVALNDANLLIFLDQIAKIDLDASARAKFQLLLECQLQGILTA